MGRTGIYACGESVSRRNSLESVALFSLKQEAPASIGGSTFTNEFEIIFLELAIFSFGQGDFVLLYFDVLTLSNTLLLLCNHPAKIKI